MHNIYNYTFRCYLMFKHSYDDVEHYQPQPAVSPVRDGGARGHTVFPVQSQIL